MKKLLLFIFCINIAALGSIFRTISNEFGNAFSLRIFIPLVIISSTNLAASMAIFARFLKEKEDSSRKEQKDTDERESSSESE